MFGGENTTDQSDAVFQWHSKFKILFYNFLRQFGRDQQTVDEHELSKFEKIVVESAGEMSQIVKIDFSEFSSFGADDLGDFLRRNYHLVSQELEELGREFVDTTARQHNVELPTSSRSNLMIVGAPTIHTVRSLRCDLLGELSVLRATVTRMTDVRPELRIATFECTGCGTLIPNIVQKFKLTDPTICPKKGCGNRTKWLLRQEGCVFGDWQKLRVQENAEEIPAGSMPRTIDVILREDSCEQCKPGDKVRLSGCLIAVPDVPSLMKPGDVPKSIARGHNLRERSEFGLNDNAISGLRLLGVRDLAYRLVFLGHHVIVTNQTGDASRSETMGMGALLESKFQQVAASPKCLDLLATSFAPEVFGHESLKKGLLLMLVGGVEKWTVKDNIKLRGDINVCILGDPGTAKSQMLKYVQSFATRAVYASGKTSTAAGLTVTVQRDPEQRGESVIEAGALMLADKGVCCIDEFDKMDEKDLVAIHEAMEQQTISIAKAGIQATLNARASVLAACNPSGGRYDTSKTFRQNVRLSAPILSRFDLFFVMVDDVNNDSLIARHVTQMHTDPNLFAKNQIAQTATSFSREQLQLYIRMAKSQTPALTEEARDLIVRSYAALRQRDLQPGCQRNIRTTVRQLEALIRLSEAAAKLHFVELVQRTHVNEAYRIFCDSLTRVRKDQIDLADDESNSDDNDEMMLDADEFEQLAMTIIERLKQIEQTNSSSDSFVEKTDLIAWLLNQQDEAQDEVELQMRCRKLSLLLHRMTTRDLTLIEEVREAEGRGQVTVLRLHPNFGGADYNANRMHANLPTAFFGGEATTNESSKDLVASALLGEADFEELMQESMEADALFAGMRQAMDN